MSKMTAKEKAELELAELMDEHNTIHLMAATIFAKRQELEESVAAARSLFKMAQQECFKGRAGGEDPCVLGQAAASIFAGKTNTDANLKWALDQAINLAVLNNANYDSVNKSGYTTA